MSQPRRRAVAVALRPFRLVPALLAASLCLAGCNWLQFAGSSSHQGNNSTESTLTVANVSGLHQLFQTTLPSTADGAPAFVENVSTPSGTHNLLFVTTRAGDLVAVDAVSGAIVWQAHHPAGTCKINNGSTTCYTTSSPVVDPNLQYVYTYGLDGYVHKHAIGTGTEVTDAHWPVLSTLKPWDEKGSLSPPRLRSRCPRSLSSPQRSWPSGMWRWRSCAASTPPGRPRGWPPGGSPSASCVPAPRRLHPLAPRWWCSAVRRSRCW